MSNRQIETGAVPHLSLVAPSPVRTRIKSGTPLYDRILVRQLEDNQLSRGGIAIPAMANQNRDWARGEVVMVGGGRVTLEGKVVPLLLKAGDLVLYPRKSAQPIPLGDDDGATAWVLLREPDVLMTIEVEEVPLIEVVSEVDSSEVGL